MIVEVYGNPAPQGSKKCFCRGNKAVMLEQTAGSLKPWRNAVLAAALVAKGGQPPMDGPLEFWCTWVVARPAKPKFDQPAVAPDLSKVMRATEDALTDAGVWVDDSRVVAAVIREVYVGDPRDPLGRPGCLLLVRAAT